jgi:hypothetical protein
MGQRESAFETVADIHERVAAPEQIDELKGEK